MVKALIKILFEFMFRHLHSYNSKGIIFDELQTSENLTLIQCAGSVQSQMVPPADTSGRFRFENGNAFRYVKTDKSCKTGIVPPFSDGLDTQFVAASTEGFVDDAIYVVEGCMPNGTSFL